MADMVSSVVRNTGIDAISAAMSIAASGEPTAPRDANRVAGELLERATVMQTENRPFPRDRRGSQRRLAARHLTLSETASGAIGQVAPVAADQQQDRYRE